MIFGTKREQEAAKVSCKVASRTRSSASKRQLFRIGEEVVSTGDACKRLGIDGKKLSDLRRLGLASWAEYEQRVGVKA